jgi:hypothetical protein
VDAAHFDLDVVREAFVWRDPYCHRQPGQARRQLRHRIGLLEGLEIVAMIAPIRPKGSSRKRRPFFDRPAPDVPFPARDGICPLD